MKLKKYAKKITERTGCTADVVKWITKDGIQDRIIVNTDYEGTYPTRKTIEDINKVILMVSRNCGKYELEISPAKVCCYVWEAPKRMEVEN